MEGTSLKCKHNLMVGFLLFSFLASYTFFVCFFFTMNMDGFYNWNKNKFTLKVGAHDS